MASPEHAFWPTFTKELHTVTQLLHIHLEDAESLATLIIPTSSTGEARGLVARLVTHWGR